MLKRLSLFNKTGREEQTYLLLGYDKNKKYNKNFSINLNIDTSFIAVSVATCKLNKDRFLTFSDYKILLDDFLEKQFSVLEGTPDSKTKENKKNILTTMRNYQPLSNEDVDALFKSEQWKFISIQSTKTNQRIMLTDLFASYPSIQVKLLEQFTQKKCRR